MRDSAAIQAVLLSGPGVAPIIAPLPMPQPGPGQVLVKMAYSPINPSDLAFLAGTYGLKKPYPVVPGLEGSGEVVAAGKGLLPRLWLGRRVACASSPRLNGTWATHMVTEAARCVPLQQGISLQQGAMMFVNPLTVLAFMEMIRHEKHQAIIHTAAASSLGRMLLRSCLTKGIDIICVVRKQAQVDDLAQLGAKHIINTADPSCWEQLQAKAKALKATLALDAVGGPMPAQLLDALQPRGKVVIYGRLSHESASPPDLTQFIFSHKQISGFWLTHWLAEQSFVKSILLTRKVQTLLQTDLQSNLQA